MRATLVSKRHIACPHCGNDGHSIEHLFRYARSTYQRSCGPSSATSRRIKVEDCLDWSNDRQERDLEVWRQAYNAALSCPGVASSGAKDLADNALEYYRAKREEMRK